MSSVDAPKTSPLPPEIIGEIVGAAWDSASCAAEDASRETLTALTYVSRIFYTLARKRLWESVTLHYYPYQSSGSPHRNTKIYDILCDNPDLRADIRALTIEISTDDLEGIAPDVIANPSTIVHRTWSEESAKDRDSFLGTLYLLALASELRSFTIFTRPRSRPPYTLPMAAILDDETLFALTALRICPPLESSFFLYLVDPPPALIFGDPRADTLKQVTSSIGFSRSPFDNSNHDYTVERQSTPFDIPNGVYDATKRAISYFASPYPTPLVLFPKLLKLWYVAPEKRQHVLPEYLVERGYPSRPWGGHMPLLENLSITASGFNLHSGAVDHDREDSAFIHTASPTIKSLLLNGVSACRSVKDFAYVPQLSELSFIGTLSTRHSDETDWLAEVSRLLGKITPPQSLHSLSVEFHVFSETVEAYQADILSWGVFWSSLDDVFVRLAATLHSRRLAVNIKLLADVSQDDRSIDVQVAFESTREKVQGLLPRCRGLAGVSLDINAKLWR